MPAGGNVIRMPFEPRSLATILAASQSRPPNADASATPANRTAAEEPQPMPTGMPLRMRISSGTIVRWLGGKYEL